jgi:hypothetical protein
MDGIHFSYNSNEDKVFMPPYKIVLELKPSTRTNNGYKFYFRHEIKYVNSNTVVFYAKNILDALQTFDANEVKKMTIEFGN